MEVANMHYDLEVAQIVMSAIMNVIDAMSEEEWQSITVICRQVRGRLEPEGIRISREQVAARLNKLQREGKVECREAKPGEVIFTRGRRDLLLFRKARNNPATPVPVGEEQVSPTTQAVSRPKKKDLLSLFPPSPLDT